jgi:hypothetical protein
MWRKWPWQLFNLFNVLVTTSYYAEPQSFLIVTPCNISILDNSWGGKYSKWIVILQEFDLDFEHTKSNMSLVFSELICDLPFTETENVAKDSLPNESLFLISFDDIWYRDIIIYLQSQTFQCDISSIDHLRI